MIEHTYNKTDIEYLYQLPIHLRLLIVVGFLKVTKKANTPVDLELNGQIEYF